MEKIKEQLLTLKGMRGYISDGFNELYDELGVDKGFDLEFNMCDINNSDDCHKINVALKGGHIAVVRYDLQGEEYEITSVELV